MCSAARAKSSCNSAIMPRLLCDTAIAHGSPTATRSGQGALVQLPGVVVFAELFGHDGQVAQQRADLELIVEFGADLQALAR